MNPDLTSLDRLHDIIIPPAAPWWPPAPGWYWVFGFVAIAFLIVALRLLLRWQHNCYRREALAELARLEAALDDPAQRGAALTGFAELLKRAALSAWPREDLASLTGSAWLSFLDHTGRTKSFTEGPGALLEPVAYDPRLADGLKAPQLHELAGQVRHWLKHHCVEPTGDRP
jgi:Domain of unknown function (DUF4381)